MPMQKSEYLGRTLISGGSEFEEKIGYSRAVIVGDTVFVAGTTGFDYQTMTISDDPAEQAEQCLKNIDEALRAAGSSLEHSVRVHYIVPKREDFEPCWPVLHKYLGQARPAATMFVAELADTRMKIEIEITATVAALAATEAAASSATASVISSTTSPQ